MVLKIAIFGEAEKGSFGSLYKVNSLDVLYDTFGNPPPESEGLFLAIQALLHEFQLIFFRVEEEGFSLNDYLKGLSTLRERETALFPHALGIPGVGNSEIIEVASRTCSLYKSLLILKEKDFYDYLTN